jgi:hypothetical protein
MGFEPMNNGFAGRRVSHFATRAHIEPLLIAAQKHKTHYRLAVGSTETYRWSIKPECQNKRVRSNNTCWRNRRSSESGSSWDDTLHELQNACKSPVRDNGN